jgi:hypothetical protein
VLFVVAPKMIAIAPRIVVAEVREEVAVEVAIGDIIIHGDAIARSLKIGKSPSVGEGGLVIRRKSRATTAGEGETTRGSADAIKATSTITLVDGKCKNWRSNLFFCRHSDSEESYRRSRRRERSRER